MFREENATAMAAYFLSRAPEKKLNDLVLMKLMVISERACMIETTSLITGAGFMSMQNGPILSHVLDLMKGTAKNQFWSQYIEFVPWARCRTESNHCILKQALDPTQFLSQHELKVLDQVWQKHGSKSKWDLVELTHEFPEWNKECATTKSSSPISLESIFELGFNKTHEQAAELAQEIDYFETVCA